MPDSFLCRTQELEGLASRAAGVLGDAFDAEDEAIAGEWGPWGETRMSAIVEGWVGGCTYSIIVEGWVGGCTFSIIVEGKGRGGAP